MSDDLIHAKFGAIVAGSAFRVKLLRNQGLTVYDIYTVHYSFTATSIMATNELMMMALSTRKEDQVDDFASVAFDEMSTAEGIWGIFALMADLDTEGGTAVVPVHTISFTKPYTVPWLATVINSAVLAAAQVSVDVWFVRREVSGIEKASLVARLGGGRARTE